MNYSEDLEMKLQQVSLAILEVNEDQRLTDLDKRKILTKLVNFKNAIIYKGTELNIDLKVS